MNIPVPQINALFAPRPPLEYIPPIDVQLRKKRKQHEITGVSAYLQYLETGQEYDEVMKKWKPIEQRPERRERIRKERKAMCDETLAEKAAAWDPSSYTFDTDAYKTLFIGRLNFMTDEHKIKREMEQVAAPSSASSCVCVCVDAVRVLRSQLLLLFLQQRVPASGFCPLGCV
jgi:U1 small nuclear ribonucleoprotein